PHGPCLSARATRYQIKQCCAAQQNWVPMTASGQSRLMQCETTNGLFPLFPKPGRKTSTSTRLACTRANVAGLSSARLYLGFPPERHSHTVVMSEERLVVANGTSFKTEGHDGCDAPQKAAAARNKPAPQNRIPRGYGYTIFA